MSTFTFMDGAFLAVGQGDGPSINPEILWLEADYGVTESGGAVSAWGDRTSNAYSFTQGTAGNRPTLTAAQINGLPVLRFDGGDWLSMSTTLLNTSGTTAEIYIVADHRGGAEGALISTRGVVNSSFTLRYNNATTLLYFHTGFSPNISRTITDKYNLIEVDRNGLSVAVGDSGTLPGATTLGGFTVSSTGTFIGAEQEGAGSLLNGDIAAVVIATSDRAGILSYLQTKYGV
jgi:hypothetical protein